MNYRSWSISIRNALYNIVYDEHSKLKQFLELRGGITTAYIDAIFAQNEPGNGHFIQFTSDPAPGEDVAIPDTAGSEGSSISFGVLEAAQAMGDRQALLNEGRRVIRIQMGDDAEAGLTQIVEQLA